MDPCEALAVRIAEAASLSRGAAVLAHAVGGPLMRAAIAVKWPDTPPALGCLVYAWKAMLDPDATAPELLGAAPLGHAVEPSR